jgi:predicted house-cleaning noncanonical NTP pyrophosphatase (MazG superfamily)
MKKYSFNKLIRSNLPKRMSQEGIGVFGRQLKFEEFAKELRNKLIEEATEVLEADSKINLIKELADVMEVILHISSLHDITEEQIEQERLVKLTTNGHFAPENFIDYIEVPNDNYRMIDYLENRNRPYKYMSPSKKARHKRTKEVKI